MKVQVVASFFEVVFFGRASKSKSANQHDPSAPLDTSDPLSGDVAPDNENDDQTKDQASSPEPYFLKVRRNAMAGEFEVRLNMGQYETGTEAALAALTEIDEIEKLLSFFDPESEISRINRDGSFEPVTVDSDTFELLASAQRLYEETSGAFDITATPLWEAWGFSRRDARVPDPEEIAGAMETVGGRFVQLDRETETVRLLKPGVRINLGGIGKGYAIDRCADRLFFGEDIRDFLVHGAASSILARGTQAGRSSGWPVGVAHPIRSGGRIAEIQLNDAALATSGGRHQSMMHKGQRLSHIIDPRTGQPAEGVYSVTVVAPSAAEADALATAMFVLGLDQSLAYCSARPELAALFLLPSKCRDRELDIQHVGFGGGTLHLL